MIRFDDQPPMSPAADKWANSALKKSEKYRDKDASNLSYYGKNKHQTKILRGTRMIKVDPSCPHAGNSSDVCHPSCPHAGNSDGQS